MTTAATNRQFCRKGIHNCIPAVTLSFDGGTRQLHWCDEHVADAERYRSSSDSAIVTIAGQDYERHTCYICHGTGAKHDATNAEVIGADRSGICHRCKGSGHILTTVLPPEVLRIREQEAAAAMPEWVDDPDAFSWLDDEVGAP